MRLFTGTAAVAIIAAATPAHAGEEVLYQPAPEWVEVAELADTEGPAGTPVRLLEQQVRLDDGRVWTYVDSALALDSPEALTRMGTLSAQWYPDKGDLIIHRVELLRDGELIDVLATGSTFETLRRERGLENRMLDGVITATMPLPGARVGDVVRMAYSTTLSDQALGEEMQWATTLISKPFPLQQGRVIASWPSDAQVQSKMLAQTPVGALEERKGFTFHAVDLPMAEPKDMPYDAPSRYRLPPTLQVTSFADWPELSRQMAPLFEASAGVGNIAELRQEVAAIKEATTDPLARAALATQLVQDEISYLLNGMNGGNYIPQTVAETWEKRYGDCKAKSLLLLAILADLDIEAQALLVQTSFGDALPELLPMPGNFDHVIVRAIIGGQDYWLDGTASGTRLENIADVPKFYYGLPLRDAGSTLLEMQARPLAIPSETVRVTIDQTAGITVPALYTMEATVSGPSAAPWQAIAQMNEVEQRDDMVDGAAYSVMGDSQVVDRSVSFDKSTGTAQIKVTGIMTSPWTFKNGLFETTVPMQLASQFGVNADRARQEWRDIPVVVASPRYEMRELPWLLPERAFKLLGDQSVAVDFGGNALRSDARFDGDRLLLSQSIRSSLWELPAEQLSEVKRESARLKRSLPSLQAPPDVRRQWQYRGSDRKILEPLEKAYAAVIADADDDDARVYSNRASFRIGTGDFKGALEDFDEAIERKASADLYAWRSDVKLNLGDLTGALSDAERAEALDANGSTHWTRIEILGLLGRTDQVVELADDYALLADDFEDGERMRAYSLGWAGQAEEGLEVLRDLAASSSENPSRMNDVCWFAGIWNLVDEEVLRTCTAAVERGGLSAAARDSRALALHRLGRDEQAIEELDDVLTAFPDQHDSRYLRGLIRLAAGDSGGRADVDSALWGKPALRKIYEAYGLAPA